MNFDEFQSWVFSLDDKAAESALSLAEEEEPPEVIAEWLIRCMQDWEENSKGIPSSDLNDIIWRVGGEPLWLGSSFYNHSRLTLDQQSRLLEAAKFVSLSIPALFTPEEPVENGYFMWWDMLAKSIDNPDLAQQCLNILSELSQHADSRVQVVALHGLGHLSAPGREAVVDEYIRRHPEYADNDWILQCRNGTVM